MSAVQKSNNLRFTGKGKTQSPHHLKWLFPFFVFSTAKGAFPGFPAFFAHAENPGKSEGKTGVSRLSYFSRNLEKPGNAKRKFSTLSVWKRQENIFHSFKAYGHMCKKAWSCSQEISCSPSAFLCYVND